MKRITKFSLLLSLVLGLYFPTVFAQSNMTNEMFDLAKLKSGVKNKRISSTDPTGGNRDHLEPFKPGEKRVIADIKGGRSHQPYLGDHCASSSHVEQK